MCDLLHSLMRINLHDINGHGPLEAFSGGLNRPGHARRSDTVAETKLGAVHMSLASPANRVDLSHENLYFSTT